MSIFGGRVAIANALIDAEFAQLCWYQPMTEVVNADPIHDPMRLAGECRPIIIQPGTLLGSGWSLEQMHQRSTSEASIWYMAQGVLEDVQKFDRFVVKGTHANPHFKTGTRAYEVTDGPRPCGHGRYTATLVEIPVPADAVSVDIEFLAPATSVSIEFAEMELPF